MRESTAKFVLVLVLPFSYAQGINRTWSAPQYTTMHYVLMAASVFLVASLVLGILVLVRKDIGRRARAPRRQVIKVQPRQREPSVADSDLVVEDLVDGQFTTIASSKRTSIAK